jgi:hypothetical protein
LLSVVHCSLFIYRSRPGSSHSRETAMIWSVLRNVQQFCIHTFTTKCMRWLLRVKSNPWDLTSENKQVRKCTHSITVFSLSTSRIAGELISRLVTYTRNDASRTQRTVPLYCHRS